MTTRTFRRALLPGLLLLAAATGISDAQDDAADPLSRMRREIEELKAQVKFLQEQVAALRSAAPDPAPPAGPRFEEPVATAPADPSPQPTVAQRASTFNPAITAAFLGIGRTSLNSNRDEDGFSLSEAEIGLQAVVDPYARVDLFVALTSEGEAEIEEAVVASTSMPGGLQIKGGRYKNAFGKWNTLHAHQFFTADAPDALTGFFGEESLTSDGVSVSWLVPGTGPVYLESITELGSTGNDASFNARRRDYLVLQRLSSVFNLTPSATLGIGASAAFGKGSASELLRDGIDDAGLSGVLAPSDRLASNLYGLDFTYKWRPLRYSRYRSLMWQTELLAGRRQVESLDPAGFLDKDLVRSFGGYSYGEYQFARRWRAGMRYDATEFPDDAEARQRAVSGIVRFQPTEYQEFLIQFKHTGRNRTAASRFDDIRHDNEIFIQWTPVIGAHAAHTY